MTKSSSVFKDYPLWRALLSWALTPIYWLTFFAILLIFDLILKIAWFLGAAIFNFSFKSMNFFLVNNFKLMGTKIRTDSPALPLDRPLLVVSNHQSMYDIPLLIWVFRRHHLKFISKKELGRGLPGISFPLRRDGSVLIDRKNPAQAIPAIKEFGKLAAMRTWSACLFPEGTRARDGVLKKFKPSGFLALLESIPSALVVPVAIRGSWEMVRYNLLPVPFGVKFELRVLDPIEPQGKNPERLLEEIHDKIADCIKS